MHSVLEREREYRRRLGVSFGLALVLQLLAWWLVPSPLGRPIGLLPGIRGGTGGGLSLCEVVYPRAGPASAVAPAAVPPIPIEAPLPSELVPKPDAEVEVTSEAIPSGAPAAAAVEVAGSGTAGTGTDPGDAAGTGSPGEGDGAVGDGGSQVLHPQLWVHPEMPQRVLVQRKIDDFVLLQVLVGSDGRVHDVRTLRDIPNCGECNRSAVDAAWRLTFDPPVVPASTTGVWSQIFNYRFSYR